MHNDAAELQEQADAALVKAIDVTASIRPHAAVRWTAKTLTLHWARIMVRCSEPDLYNHSAT